METESLILSKKNSEMRAKNDLKTHWLCEAFARVRAILTTEASQ
jgi:hypothetical protein